MILGDPLQPYTGLGGANAYKNAIIIQDHISYVYMYIYRETEKYSTYDIIYCLYLGLLLIAIDFLASSYAYCLGPV